MAAGAAQLSRTHVVDCDVHCVPPAPDALYPYVDAHWAEYMRNVGFKGASAVATTYPPWSPMLATEGDDLTLERLRADVLGTADLAVLHCYYGVESFTHPYFGPAVATAVNRWLSEEWLARDERLLAYAVVTPQHVPAAVAELERVAAEPRFVGVLVPARAPATYGSQRYWPIWEAAAAHGLAIGITYGGGGGSPPTPVGWLGSYWEDYAVAPLAFHGHVASLAVSGLFDRHPELRVVLHESGWTWLPGLCWRLDQEWRAMHREVPWLDGPPSSYVERFVRVTTQPVDAPDARTLLRLLEHMQLDRMLMHASDYPHRYGGEDDALLAVLDEEQAVRVRWQNAASCYRLAERLAL